jgi:hypothetical protein
VARSRLKSGSDDSGGNVSEKRPAAQAPGPRRQSRGEAAEDIVELPVHTLRADESAVVDGLAEEKPAVSGEQLPSFFSGTGGELRVVGIRLIGDIDAEQPHPPRECAEVHVEKEPTGVRLRPMPGFNVNGRRVAEMRGAKLLTTDPSAIHGCGPDFGQRHTNDLEKVCHRFRGSRVAHDSFAPVASGQQGPE